MPDSPPKDVFICYARRDDEPPPGLDTGIVTRLETALKYFFDSLTGGNLDVRRDTKLRSGDDWRVTLASEARVARVFIPLLSPSWVRSTECRAEWNVFRETHTGDHPPVLPFTLSPDADFVSQLPESIKAMEIKYKLHPTISQDELNRIMERASKELRTLLPSPEPSAPVKTVFLGHAFSPPMAKWRNAIRRELEGKGFKTVAVDPTNPDMTAESFIAAVRSATSESVAAVHFLDEYPGRFEGDKNSVIQVQYRASSSCPKTYAWIGPDLQVEQINDDAYRTFVGSVVASNESVVEFQKRIIGELTRSSTIIPPGITPVVCLVCESGDEAAADISAFLSDKGIVVRSPGRVGSGDMPFGSSEKAFRDNEHFLVYWGIGTAEWWMFQWNSFCDARSVGPGQLKSPKTAALYFGQSETEAKRGTSWPWRMIRRYDRFDRNALTEFVADILKAPNNV